MLRIVLVVMMTAGTLSGSVVWAASGDKMSTVEAVNTCRAELGKDAKYLKVRACVIRKKKGE